MIEAFLDSWFLFRYTYLAGWGAALSLSLLGVFAVARDQIFLCAASSQAAILGIAVAMCLGVEFGAYATRGLGSELLVLGFAVSFGSAASFLAMRKKKPGAESPEAVIGWIYLLASSLSVLLLAHSPHGLDEVLRLSSSSLIGASRLDVWLTCGLLIAVIALLMLRWRELLIVTLDPDLACTAGLEERFWSCVLALLTGAAIGLAIHIAGTLFALGSIILPALIARNLCNEIRLLFWVSPIIALLTTSAGFILANHYDLPPAQVGVGIACVALPASWSYQRLLWNRQ